jgi:hypothetical protein
MLKLYDVHMIRVTYAVMMAIWSYPMVLALALGTWRHRCRLKADGHDRAWTTRRDPVASTPTP